MSDGRSSMLVALGCQSSFYMTLDRLRTCGKARIIGARFLVDSEVCLHDNVWYCVSSREGA